MEIYVFSDRQLQSIAGWQRAIDAAGFSLQLSNAVAFARLNGVVPVRLNDQPTVFECVHWDGQRTMSEMADTKFDRPWKYVLALRMMGRISEVAAAYMAASAYAQATGGAVFDCEEGKFITPQRAAEIAHEIETVGPSVQERVREAMRAAGPIRPRNKS